MRHSRKIGNGIAGRLGKKLVTGLRLLLEHPQHARLSCADCKKWLVDIKTAEYTKRANQKIPRPENIPTPCKECPKGSPENEVNCVLTKDNEALVGLWNMARARGWQRLSEDFFDPWNEQQISLIARVYEAFQQRQLGRTIALELVPLLVTGGKK